MNRLLIFFFLNVFASQAQTDSIRLVDIQSSECGGMYRVKPGFIRKETSGDTTLMSLFCSNNCAGYHSPGVTWSGDSVFITIHAGEKGMSPSIYYRVNGVIYSPEDLSARERKYDKKYSRSDTVIVMEESLMMASCNCCYTFELKVTGLDPSKPYKYFYNEQYIDPEYKPTGIIKEYVFPYFFKQPESEIVKNVRNIISATKNLFNAFKENDLAIYLTADTMTGKIISVRTNFDWFSSNKKVHRKLERYFSSAVTIDCIRTSFKPSLIQQYWINFSFNSETDKLELFYESGEPLSDR
ncbi:MAG: hypothetical protein ACO1N0_09465 [Fluviicola sp.]